VKARSRLKHSAAGLLGFLISRNNDVNGNWGPGLLYQDLKAFPYAIELDLLAGTVQPASGSADIMATFSAAFLRPALEKNAFAWHELTRATVRFHFNLTAPGPRFVFPCGGDPFTCTVTLHTEHGHVAVVRAWARCERHRLFASRWRVC
jgi:hypothetical protein